MKSNNPDQLSLFQVLPGLKEDFPQSPKDKISITRVHFLSQELTTYEEIFRGYNEIRVITYSYGLSFIERIMHYFDHGEVIIGFDKLIHRKTAELFTLQEFSTNYVCQNTYLQERIQKDEFHFYVLNDLVSHQKIYLLKADDGRVRTIIGSANFSEHAWNGDQIECVNVCDDPACYEVYESQYETLRLFSTDEISKDALPLLEYGENAEELPIFKKIEKQHAIVLREIQDTQEADSVFHMENLNKKWEERLKAVNIKPSKDGKILLDIKKSKLILDGIKKENTKRKEREFISPQFLLDFDTHTVSFNQISFDLAPSAEAIRNDLHTLIAYMEGFKLFTKDTKRLRTLYWKVLNYLFLSPFIAKLRYEGSRYGYEERFFPMYLLICGDSDAGKTGFVKFTRKLMFAEEMNGLTQNYFSRKPMLSLKTEVSGCPVLIDEITPTHWKYAKDIVKMDGMLIEDHLIHHPTFILLSNDIHHVAPELSKRVIVINLDNRLDRTSAAYNGKKINKLRKTAGNAFYREYLRRMFDTVDLFIEELQSHDISNDSQWIPDIFSLSSRLLIDIMHDYQVTVPDELYEFTWFDYMGDAVIGEKSTSIIKEEYLHNSGIFCIDTGKNQLEIDFSCYDSNESKKKLQNLHDELPADTECKIVGTKAIMKLDAIKRYSGINFKKKWFWRK